MAKRILLVEDDQVIAWMVGSQLLDMGYEVSRASNGLEGLGVLSKISVDGVLLDLQMPVMDGLTFLGHLRQRQATLPVMVMSGNLDHAILAKGREMGVFHYLRKPSDLASLKEKCVEVFGEPKPHFPLRGRHQGCLSSTRQMDRTPEQE